METGGPEQLVAATRWPQLASKRSFESLWPMKARSAEFGAAVRGLRDKRNDEFKGLVRETEMERTDTGGQKDQRCGRASEHSENLVFWDTVWWLKGMEKMFTDFLKCSDVVLNEERLVDDVRLKQIESRRLVDQQGRRTKSGNWWTRGREAEDEEWRRRGAKSSWN